MRDLRRHVAGIVQDGIRWADSHVPRGVRTVAGILLMCGGVVGFLPVLGFWMLPLGMAFIALDIPPLRRRVLAWAERSDGTTEEERP